MTSVGSIADFYFAVITILNLVLLVLLVLRVYAEFNMPDRFPILRTTGMWFLKTLKVLFGGSLLLFVIGTLFFMNFKSAIRPFIPDYLISLLLILLILLSGTEVFLSFSMSKDLVSKNSRKVVLSILVIVLLPLSIIMLREIPEIFRYPPDQDCYILELPVEGVWRASEAGGTKSVNYHNFFKGQKYAIDIVRMGEGGSMFTNEGKDISDFYAMGANVYSPVNGVVVHVIDSLPNADINFSPMDTLNPAGNHLVLEFEPDRFVFLAHLNTGTITVNAGDTIKAGDLIGQVGNSGNSTLPHLHMHIQDLPVIEYSNSIGYPFRFKLIKRKRLLLWSTATNEFLLRNDLFKNVNSTSNNSNFKG